MATSMSTCILTALMSAGASWGRAAPMPSMPAPYWAERGGICSGCARPCAMMMRLLASLVTSASRLNRLAAAAMTSSLRGLALISACSARLSRLISGERNCW